MKLLKYLSALLLCLVFASCGNEQNKVVLDQAIHAAEKGDFDTALTLCNSIMSSADTVNFTAGDYCRVAMIYAMAADNDVNRDINIAVAARYLDQASSMSADSVNNFIQLLPPERQAVVYSVEQLNRTKGVDFSTFEDPEYGDYYNDSLHYENH